MRRSSEFPQLADEAWLRTQYVDNDRTAMDIAAELGCTTALVHYRLRDFRIPRKGRHPGGLRIKGCERCGQGYTPSGTAQRFCSPECRAGTKTCEQCGKEFPLRPAKKATSPVYQARFCSFECQTEWRGKNCAHRWVNDQGYVEITVEPTMRQDVDSNGYVRINTGTGKLSEGRVKEHRWVMEHRLGRRLFPHEEVHHKNTIRTDNDRCPNCPARTPPPRVTAHAGKERLHCETCGWRSGHKPNLELWETSQPRGGRVADKISWAIELLSQYGKVRFTPADPAAAPSRSEEEAVTLF
jgi:hypothetical protein